MAKTKKKEIQKQGLRPSQKAKAEKLLKKQEAKKLAQVSASSQTENEVMTDSVAIETPKINTRKRTVKKATTATKEKKTTRKTTKKASAKVEVNTSEQINDNNVACTEPVATITVKNAEGEPDTVAEILIQNKIDYTPKVSVVMPVYNVEPYLRQCLDSVISQTLKEIEIICVDDGSTDASLDILKEYATKDNRITVITQNNAGSGKARNNAINNSNGEFIAFMDSDDLYPNENTLEHMYKVAIENDIFICGGSLSQLREGGEIVTDPKEFEDGYSFKEDGIVQYSDYQFDYGYWRFIYNRKFLKENQLYFPDYLRQQDPPFFVKTMATAGKFYALTEPTYVYRISYKQISWNERKTVDMFKGVADCLMLSSLHGLEKLHCSIAQRINAWTYRTATAEMLTNDKVVDQIVKTLNYIDYNILQKNDIELILDDIYKSVQRIKDKQILVSIIVPVYNVENYLTECLDSLLLQTLKNIEIICVNDGSTDKSLQILQEYASKDSRIIIVNQKNQGLPNARNSGIAVCKGLYFTFVDSDDWIDNNYVEEMYKKCVQYNADIAKSGYKNHYENEITDDNLNALINEKCKRNEMLEPYENNIISCATMYKYDFLKQHNILYFDKNILKHEDILYTLQVNAYANRIVPVAGVFYHYRRTSSVLSIFKYENCYNIPNITSKALTFINTEINDKNNYVRQAQRLVWRMLDTYEKLKDFEQFKNDEKEYLHKMKCLFEQIKYNNIVFAPYVVQLERIWGNVKKIIVSLTSYPARISFVADTVKSLLNQSIKPDKIILNLGADKFLNKEKDLPENLLSLLGNCFQIHWMEHDLRSFSKLIPTLERFPDDIIVTADDDIIYDCDWLRILIVSYLKNRKLIHCHRVHKISMNKGHPDLYKEWSFALSDGSLSFRNFLTGVGGVLYPPHCLYKDVFRKDLYMSLCPKADDIWFWAMAILNGTKIKVVENAQTSLKTIEGSQDLDTCLWKTNLEGAGENDKQLQNVIKQYPRILKILRYDNDINYFSSYVLFPYYRLLLPFLTKKSIALSVKKNISILQKFRIDVKNCGNSNNNIRVLTQNVSVSTPQWFSDKEGSGKVLCGSEMQSTIKLQAINDGKLVFDFRGNDEKYLDMRIPIWIDYKSIKINDNEILSASIATWHDKPYHYEMPVKNGQEIILKIEQQHHEYTEDELQDILFKLNSDSEYIKQHMNVVVNELKKQFSVISEEEYNRRQFENTISSIISDIASYRVDIKNIGTETNNTQICCDNGKIAEPRWLSDEQGIGKMVQGNSMINTIKVKAIGDGLLKIYFRGQDKRFDGKRFPVWIEYKSIKIDNEEMLSCPVATWHDEPYVCEIPVKNSQEVMLEFEQQYHEYTEDELRDTLSKLYSDESQILNQIDKIIKELRKTIRVVDKRNYFNIDKEFFIIDSDNLDDVQEKLYGYVIQDNGIIEDENKEYFDKDKISSCGAYVYVAREKGKITISQDFNGSYGLFLFQSGEYFALSNSFLYLVDYLKGKFNLEIDADFVNYMLAMELCSEAYDTTWIKNIKTIDKDDVVSINIYDSSILLERKERHINNYYIDTQDGIEILDRWFAKWTKIFRNIKSKTNNIMVSLSGGMDSRITFLLALKSGINLNDIRVNSIKSDLHTFGEDYEIASQIAEYFGFELNKDVISKTAVNYSFEDVVNICIYNKLPFHKELNNRKQRFVNKIYEIPGAGGEALRSHWDFGTDERTLDYLKYLESQISRKTEKLSTSVRKIAEDSYEKISEKYNVADIKSSEVLRYLYMDTRCRNHFGKGSIEDYFCGRYLLAPLLDPELLKLKINTQNCSDNNLLISVIFTRYCPDLLKFKIEGGRKFNEDTIAVAKMINDKYPVDMEKLLSGNIVGEYHVSTENRNIKNVPGNLNKGISKEQLDKFFENSFNSKYFENIVTKYIDDDVYLNIQQNCKKRTYYPLRDTYPLFCIACISNSINGENKSENSNYEFLMKCYNNYEKVSKDFHSDVAKKSISVPKKDSVDNLIDFIRTYRIDIKNHGIKTNNLQISCDNGDVEEPRWLTDEQGIGKMICGSDFSNVIRIKAIGDGILRIYFRGQDKRFDGNRFPIWIDYKSIKIDGKEILSMPVTTWHNKPYHYEMPVKDGQEITIEIEQQYHQYTKDELSDVLQKNYSGDEFVKENINEIAERILQSTGSGYSAIPNINFPEIVADCFIPIGEACRVANWLRKNNLRYCSFPFDWVDGCSLNFIIKSIKQGISDWFNEYITDPSKDNKKHHYVYDTKNKFRARHIFPLEKSVEEYMPEFRELFNRRYDKLIEIIEKSKTICFICNARTDEVYDFYLFVKEMCNLYPNKKYKLLHIQHNEKEQSVSEYMFDDMEIYIMEAYDIHKNGNNKSTNPDFWIGNEDLWNEVCSHLSLSEEAKKNLLQSDNAITCNRAYLEAYKSKEKLDETKYSWDYVKNNLLTHEPQKISIDDITEKTCGLLQIAIENTKFESVLIPSKIKKLYVFLSSGGKDVRYPIFHRIPTIEHYNGTCVFFDDPTRNEINDNGISWYLGGKGEYINYLTRIIRKISESHDIESSNITLIGSSNAGFAVLQMANKLSGVKCIALNPQLSVFLHMGKKARDAFEKKIGMSFSDDKYNNILYADKFLENNNSKIFLFMNKKSTLDEVQIAYLQELLGEILPVGFNKIKDNIFCEIVDIDAPNPHNVVPNEIYTPIIDKIMDEDVTMDIKKEVCNAIAEEMKQYYAQINTKGKDSAA